MPHYKLLKRAFQNNPDGFGLAYKLAGGMPHIRKGAMTFKMVKRLLKSLPDLTAADVILHFRLATQEHIYEGNCHPFPLSRNPKHLTALDITSRMAIAHNGIIYSNLYGYKDTGGWGSKDAALSDTQEFIQDYLVDIGDAIFNAGVRRLIQDDTMSKFAILTTKGILFVGTFTKDNGLYFSNDSYKKSNYYAPSQSYDWKGKDIPETRKQGDMFLCDLCNQPFDKVTLYQGDWLCNLCYSDIVKSWQDGE